MTPQAKAAAKTGAKAPKLGAQGSVELPRELVGERFHKAIVYEAARAELLARRRGTARTKSRGEVRGGGTKPWRQKGTGRARAGSTRAPHWTGGGAAFGPEPRGYMVKVNRKARRRALRAALSLHAERGSIAVVDPAEFDEPSTRQAANALTDWDADLPVLVLLDDEEDACARSFRNIGQVTVLPASDAGVADLVGAASVVASAKALDVLTRLAGESKGES
ncbi:MAG TPA: 50S ribosomal protein L4 [Myxococcales bacterium]|jgi:large subunit ribosomal protein L4|nr:50S ribosomal protein L4 [Myxococcales bacterium]